METSNERNAGSLILSQIAMFNEAMILFSETVEPEVLSCIDKIVEDFCKKSNKWTGTFEFKNSYDCYVYLQDWNHSKELESAEPIAWFAIDIDAEKECEDFWTAIFCNESRGGIEAGFKFSVEHSVFGGKKAWKNYISLLDQKITAELESVGFKNIGQNEGNYFISFHLNAETLAAAYNDANGLDYEHETFDPVREALEKIDVSVDLFQKLISQAPTNNS